MSNTSQLAEETRRERGLVTGHDFTVCGKYSDVGLVLKGAGFSPYVKPPTMRRALAPENVSMVGKLTFSATSSVVAKMWQKWTGRECLPNSMPSVQRPCGVPFSTSASNTPVSTVSPCFICTKIR